MSKEQCLDMIRLLAALQSWTFATKESLPDYLLDDIGTAMDLLYKEALKCS